MTPRGGHCLSTSTQHVHYTPLSQSFLLPISFVFWGVFFRFTQGFMDHGLFPFFFLHGKRVEYYNGKRINK